MPRSHSSWRYWVCCVRLLRQAEQRAHTDADPTRRLKHEQLAKHLVGYIVREVFDESHRHYSPPGHAQPRSDCSVRPFSARAE